MCSVVKTLGVLRMTPVFLIHTHSHTYTLGKEYKPHGRIHGIMLASNSCIVLLYCSYYIYVNLTNVLEWFSSWLLVTVWVYTLFDGHTHMCVSAFCVFLSLCVCMCAYARYMVVCMCLYVKGSLRSVRHTPSLLFLWANKGCSKALATQPSPLYQRFTGTVYDFRCEHFSCFWGLCTCSYTISFMGSFGWFFLCVHFVLFGGNK